MVRVKPYHWIFESPSLYDKLRVKLKTASNRTGSNAEAHKKVAAKLAARRKQSALLKAKHCTFGDDNHHFAKSLLHTVQHAF